MKKVLVIYYSQTGQLKDILNNFLVSFSKSDDILLDVVRIEPSEEFVFPWNGKSFFSVMPDSVLENPVPLKDFNFAHEAYDLIIFGYQPWFLNPSIPATSLLNNKKFISILDGTPVVTVIGARNMWINAHEKVKASLKKHGANPLGNIVLVDNHQNLLSVVSITYWMFTGKKERYLGIFPKPGIAEEEIGKARQYGDIVLQHLLHEKMGLLQQQLVKSKAIEVKKNLMIIEGRGSKIFSIWARIIAGKKNKTFWLNIFKYYLIFALVFIAPIVLLANLILSPLLYKYIRKKQRYYLGLN
ncbi:MAG: hypothetical protein ACNS60_00940 [Candidatus Cyclobacteriaceae bacterium M2_1C_046]